MLKIRPVGFVPTVPTAPTALIKLSLVYFWWRLIKSPIRLIASWRVAKSVA